MICNVVAEIPLRNQYKVYTRLIDELDVVEILRCHWFLPDKWCRLLDPNWLPF